MKTTCYFCDLPPPNPKHQSNHGKNIKFPTGNIPDITAIQLINTPQNYQDHHK